MFTENISLSCQILPEESIFKVMSSKIELKLKKAEIGLRWDDLETAQISEKPKIEKHNQTKDWDKLAKDITEEENKNIEAAGGDAALQQMFKVCFSF